MDLNRDYQELLQSFVSHNVRFLIVGGYALAAHGHPRYTKDLDIWVWTDPSNAERIVMSLESFGFDGLGLTALDFQEPGVVVQLGREPQRVDILTFATGLDFASIHGFNWRYVIDDRTNKLATGRLRDIADAADLPPAQE
jgi:hypothetical protein